MDEFKYWGLGVVGLLAVFITLTLAHTFSERERMREACTDRGGHISEGMSGGSSFMVCVEPDGSMPMVPSNTTVVTMPIGGR
jgi:hypothetical protein